MCGVHTHSLFMCGVHALDIHSRSVCLHACMSPHPQDWDIEHRSGDMKKCGALINSVIAAIKHSIPNLLMSIAPQMTNVDPDVRCPPRPPEEPQSQSLTLERGARPPHPRNQMARTLASGTCFPYLGGYEPAVLSVSGGTPLLLLKYDPCILECRCLVKHRYSSS
jgi:hypothetical protein